MPSIKYKKKTYAGATFPVLEMTKAEYDALPEAKKMDGTVYMITDDTGGWEAENSAYDNTESGLTATNVQDALDETNLDLNNLSSVLSTKVQDNTRVINIKGNDLSALMNADSCTFCFMVTRVSIASAYVACLNRYNGTIYVKDVYNSGSFTTVTNSAGTVSIRYSGSTMGVYGIGLLKLPS